MKADEWKYKIKSSGESPYIRIVRIWVGTDALTLRAYPPGSRIWYVRIFMKRIFYKLFWRVFTEHWVAHPRLKKYLVWFGIPADRIIVFRYDRGSTKSANKVRHDGFNVLYYAPKSKRNMKFKRWVYGLDIVDAVKKLIDGITWIEVDGSADMSKVYPYVDAMIRPSRHDGDPRMPKECRDWGIPFYWDESFKPSVAAVMEFLEGLREN